MPAKAALLQAVWPHPTPGTLLALAPASAGLPFARQEVESLARLFPAPNEVSVGRDATEARFKQDAGRFRLLHLATHGFFNRVNPLFSGSSSRPAATTTAGCRCSRSWGCRSARTW